MSNSYADNLVSLDCYKEQDIIKTIYPEAIKGKVQILILHERENRFMVLQPGHINQIRNKHPKKTKIILEKGVFRNGDIIEFSYEQDASYSLLWVNKIFADELLKTPSHNIEGESKNIFQEFSTPLIELMIKAIREFWLNHDSEATPPKQDQIVPWLRQEGKELNISDREAIAIDMIIRPPKYKAGG